MTRTYSAADLANAQFAKHPDGRTAMKSSGYARWDVKFLDGHISTRDNYHLASFGWVPVSPARTIHDSDVEALCTDTASYERDDYLDGFIQGFQKAGGVILDDPEPTNTDMLEELIISAPGNFEGVKAILKRPANVRAWAEYLNDHGVTAPNVKGN